MNDVPSDPRRAELGSKILVAVLVGLFLFGMAGFAIAVIDAQEPEPTRPPAPSLPAIPVAGDPPARSEDAPATPAVASSGPTAAAASRVLLALADGSGPRPLRGASPAPVMALPASSLLPAVSPSASAPPAAPLSRADEGSPQVSAMPIVPVTRFWSSKEGLTRAEVVRALRSGTTRGFDRVFIEESIADPLAAALDLDIHPDVRRTDLARVGRAVRKGALGVIAAADADPALRLLKVDGASLVGIDRVRDLEDWPLTIPLGYRAADGLAQVTDDGDHDTDGGAERWDQSRTWVLVAGGDAFTDRGVYDTVVRKGKGVDYPFDGGTARVTGSACCDPVFNANVVPRYELTGNKGVVRTLFRSAELAIANHEQPVTEAAVFHRSGLRFSGKPELTKIFSRAGIDWMSLANNHIKDFGADGIDDTRRILRRHGIAFGGAGKDLEQARRISYLEARGTRVAVIPCLDIVQVYWAGARESGATPCLDRYLVPDIKQAQRRADVVIVFPHWGVEYTRQPLPSMRKHAARWAKAGADLILGAHSHVAGAIEDHDGTPVLYSLGNLIFDQRWSTNTMESALVEATFHGDRLIELRLVPYIIHDMSQPNLLDPGSGEGRRLLRAVRKASADWLEW